MAPGLLPIQSRWDAPLVTALTAVSFWCFLVQPCFLWGTDSWYMCCCCLRHSRGVSHASCEKREAHGSFWSVGFSGYLWGGAGWVRASPELLEEVGLSPSRRSGCRCVVFCRNARLEVASPQRVRPTIVYTIYTIHLPTFPIREMTNCVIASVAQLRRSGLVWSAAVAGGGGEGGGGSGHLSRNLPVAIRLRLCYL